MVSGYPIHSAARAITSMQRHFRATYFWRFCNSLVYELQGTSLFNVANCCSLATEFQCHEELSNNYKSIWKFK